MPRSLCVTPKPLPIGWIKIGSLVPDAYFPHQDAQRPNEPKQEQDYRVAVFNKYFENIDDKTNISLRIHLTKLLGEKLGWDNSVDRSVTAAEGRLYELSQPNTWFKTSCESQETKDWLQTAMNSGDVYLIVGFQTYTNARYKESFGNGWSMSSKAGVPEQALTVLSIGAPFDLSGTLDIEAEATVGSTRRRTVRYTTTEEQVYAVHYKKVRFESFWRKDVDSALLGKHVIVDLTTRGDTTREGEGNEKVWLTTLVDDLGVIGETVQDEATHDTYIFLDE